MRTKLKNTGLIILTDYTNVTKSFERKLNSKYRTEKRKTDDTETQKTKTHRDENLLLQKLDKKRRVI